MYSFALLSIFLIFNTVCVNTKLVNNKSSYNPGKQNLHNLKMCHLLLAFTSTVHGLTSVYVLKQ